MKTSRRDFIKISGLGLGSLVFVPSALQVISNNVFGNNVDSILRTPTYCEICFWKCAGWAYSDGKGNIQKLIGNKNDPHCNGRLCPRGTGGVGMYNDSDRLTEPLIRAEKNGKQTFRKATWDEAFELIAKKLEKIAEVHGPECIALFSHGTGGKFFKDLVKAYGSGNITAPSFAQCRGPREVAFEATFGEIVSSPERTDIRDTKCLVLINGKIVKPSKEVVTGDEITLNYLNESKKYKVLQIPKTKTIPKSAQEDYVKEIS